MVLRVRMVVLILYIKMIDLFICFKTVLKKWKMLGAIYFCSFIQK